MVDWDNSIASADQFTISKFSEAYKIYCILFASILKSEIKLATEPLLMISPCLTCGDNSQ